MQTAKTFQYITMQNALISHRKKAALCETTGFCPNPLFLAIYPYKEAVLCGCVRRPFLIEHWCNMAVCQVYYRKLQKFKGSLRDKK